MPGTDYHVLKSHHFANPGKASGKFSQILFIPTVHKSFNHSICLRPQGGYSLHISKGNMP